MKLVHSLYLESLGLLVLYLVGLIAVVFIVFNTQFGVGWDALLQSPIGDKVDTVGDAVTNQLRSSPEKKWNEVLELFGGLYHVRFSVFDLAGNQVAGEKINLPEGVLEQFSLPMPHHFAGRFSAMPPPFAIAVRPFGSMPKHGAHRMPFDAARDITFGTFGSPSRMPLDDHAEGGMAVQVMRFPHIPRPAHGRFLIHTTKPDHFYFGTRIDLTGENYFRPGPSILVAATDNIWQTGLLLDFKLLAMAGGAIGLLSIVFWLPFIYRITKALSDLTLATELIAEGKFDTRLETRRKDEIGRLSEAVNSMAERLNGFVGGQKRLLADISHELFSPLARLQVALEILDGSSTNDQRAIIEDIREEVEEMNHLINELIAFSKAELKGQGRNLVSVNIDEMFYELSNRLSLNERAQIEIADGLCVVGDRLLLERSFSNVLRNSVRYAGDTSPILITASVVGSDVSILIQDRGPGVPEAALKHLAEPFFRPEPSRSRDTGGVGLGLAIVKSCVEACGGILLVRNREGGGLEVEVMLKAAREMEPSCMVDVSVHT